MPRYRFSWDNVDPAVRVALWGEPGVDPAVASALLRRRYGARPGVALVAERWAALRDGWLAADGLARGQVVAELRAARLGDAGIELSGPGGEAAYLRSCRNGPTLRRIVRDAFVSCGEQAVGEWKPAAGPPSWEAVERSLAAALGGLGPGEHLVLSVRPPGGGVVQSPLGLGFHAEPGGGPALRIEAVANAFLPAPQRLGPEVQVHLAELGWQPPTHPPGGDGVDPAGSANWFRDYDDPVPVVDVARTAVRTLRECHGAASPHALRYRALGADGADLELPGLAVAHEHVASNVAARAAEELLPTPHTAGELREEVEHALLPVLSGDTVLYDDDGDIPINVGGSQVFVRCSGDAPLVRVFAVLAVDPPSGPELLEALNDLNQRYVVGRFFWDGRCAILAVDLPATPFVANHLLHAVGTVGELGEEAAAELVALVGGHQPGQPEPPPGRDASSAGYL